MSILDLTLTLTDAELAATAARAARTEANDALDAARVARVAAIAAADAAYAAACEVDSDAHDAQFDADLAFERAAMASCAFAMAEGHMDCGASEGWTAEPSDADNFDALILERALAEAGVEAPDCEDQIEALRAMLRLAIREQLARDDEDREIEREDRLEAEREEAAAEVLACAASRQTECDDAMRADAAEGVSL